MKTEQMDVSLQYKQTITVQGGKDSTPISFDLSKVKMSADQQKIVSKLFAQNPQAAIAPEGHDPNEEQGKTGPGSKYLNADEFEKIRRLGVRLMGTEVASGPFMD